MNQVTAQLESTRFFKQHPELESSIQGTETRAMTYAGLMAGIMYDYRIVHGLHAGGSIMPGIGWTGSYRINAKYEGEEESTPLIRCQAHPVANLDFSAYLMHSMENNLGVKLYLNYNMGRGRGNYTYYTRTANQLVSTTGHKNLYLHHFSIGAEVDVLLWK